jgi:hypothetical protein
MPDKIHGKKLTPKQPHADLAEAIANDNAVATMHKNGVPLEVIVGFLSRELRRTRTQLLKAQMLIPRRIKRPDGCILTYRTPVGLIPIEDQEV